MPSSLTSHLGYWLRFVSNHVSGSFARALAERDTSVAEWVLMRLLYDGPMQPGKLAAEMNVTKGAISKLADRLVARGLLQRSAGGTDGRTQLLTLTDTARSLVPELAAIADENDRSFFSILDADEARTLETLLRRIVDGKGLMSVPIS